MHQSEDCQINDQLAVLYVSILRPHVHVGYEKHLIEMFQEHIHVQGKLQAAIDSGTMHYRQKCFGEQPNEFYSLCKHTCWLQKHHT